MACGPRWLLLLLMMMMVMVVDRAGPFERAGRCGGPACTSVGPPVGLWATWSRLSPQAKYWCDASLTLAMWSPLGLAAFLLPPLKLALEVVTFTAKPPHYWFATAIAGAGLVLTASGHWRTPRDGRSQVG